MIQKLWPAALPLVIDSMAPMRLPSGSPSSLRATGMSAIASVRKMPTPASSPYSCASSAMIGVTTVVLCWMRACSSDSVGFAPR